MVSLVFMKGHAVRFVNQNVNHGVHHEILNLSQWLVYL